MASVYADKTKVPDSVVNATYNSERLSFYQEIYKNKELAIKCESLCAFYSNKQV